MRAGGWVRGVAALVCAALIGTRAVAQEAAPPAGTPPPPAAPLALPSPAEVIAAPADGSTPFPGDAPSADSDPPTGWLSGLGADAEYLFLRPHRQDMDYAIANTTAANVPNGDVVSRDWSYRSALRVGLAYRLPSSTWSVGFFYTYLHDVTSGSVAAPDGGTLFATLTHPGTVSQVQTASALTSLNYNVYDVEVGRWCPLGPKFGVRFFGGGRFAHIDQNFTALYNGGDANLDQVTQRLHFDGGGFRGGADANWLVGCGFFLFGRGNAALLGGNFHNTLAETNNAGATILTNISDRFDKVVPVAEMTMGAGWQYRHLRLTAGYQFINWFGLVTQPTFVDDAHQGKFVRNSSNLSLEGLILRAEWWF